MVAFSSTVPPLPFAGIVTVALPLPVPFAGEAPSPEAVQLHDAFDAVIVTDADPPAAGAEMNPGVIANEQLDPNWVTV